jgi:exodeoxyribonuclease VII small subunit
MAKKEKQPFSLEAKLREIKTLLDKMQSGDQDFDENMRLFQQATATIKECRNYLDGAELSIRQLIDADGEPEEVDFE